MSKEKEIVMNGAGIEEIGFPMWPQFDEKSYDEVLDVLKRKESSFQGFMLSVEYF